MHRYSGREAEQLVASEVEEMQVFQKFHETSSCFRSGGDASGQAPFGTVEASALILCMLSHVKMLSAL